MPAAVWALARCAHPVTSPIEYVAATASNAYAGPGTEVHYVDTSGYVDLTYTLSDLSGQDVTFVLTNTEAYSAASNPVVTSASEAARTAAAPARPRRPAVAQPRALTLTPAHVQEFNANPPPFRGAAGRSASPSTVPAPQRTVVVGGTRTFNDDNGVAIAGPITARAVVTVDSVTLVIWVADSWWSDSDAVADKVSPAKLSALADKFLLTGAGNDIYDWVTNIFGVPWGPHPSDTSLIDPTSPQEIDVLLYDIDNDSALSPTSVTVGFFYARDNYRKTVLAKSNELVMFYIDAPLFAKDDGGPWAITDTWPEEVVSTLAHELQHMIHFYQKQVLRGTGVTDTWLNEMASLVTEDLVADKLGVGGPRGLTTAGAGSPGNTQGRLPLFNFYNDISLTNWGTPDALASYSMAYAFGAYLARDFGGSAFFRDVVQCSRTGSGAIDYALQQAGSGLTFGDALRRWGVAVLLSDDTTPPATYQQYNSGTWFSDTLASIIYNLGSINLYNYSDLASGQVGPSFWTGTGAIGHAAGDLAASNLYYHAATAATGALTWHIRMDAGVKLTVVVKP